MRRRILRRGLPYGKHDPGNPSDDGERGIIFMAICASLFRQFELVQQQSIQYGLDFNVGNALRQLEPNDVQQLMEAERRLLAARKVFAGKAPQCVEQVDEALSSTRSLLKIAVGQQAKRPAVPNRSG